MLRIAVVLLAALCTLSASPQKTMLPRTPPNVNPGSWITTLSDDINSCVSWIEARKGKQDPVNIRAKTIEGPSRTWIWGFVSGANAYGRRPLADVPAGALDAWVDKYCADHPLDRIDDAGIALVEELAARARGSK
jgi:hypothetical protein